MRDLRPRRDLAWQAYGADPRSHQRNPRRPPAREPEDSLSQLRRDTRYVLLSENRLARLPRECRYCGDVFVPKYDRHRYCSRACGQKWDRSRLRGVPRPSRRLVERPPLHVLLAEVARDGYLATGRKYGVSDNAIRKWVRCYENEMARRRREGADELDQAA